MRKNIGRYWQGYFLFLSYISPIGDGSPHAALLWWYMEGSRPGARWGAAAVQHGFYPVEYQLLQRLYRSSALCHSVGSCQEREANGGKRGLVYKAGSPLE